LLDLTTVPHSLHWTTTWLDLLSKVWTCNNYTAHNSSHKPMLIDDYGYRNTRFG
jgi:hypothetical protein